MRSGHSSFGFAVRRSGSSLVSGVPLCVRETRNVEPRMSNVERVNSPARAGRPPLAPADEGASAAVDQQLRTAADDDCSSMPHDPYAPVARMATRSHRRERRIEPGVRAAVGSADRSDRTCDRSAGPHQSRALMPTLAAGDLVAIRERRRVRSVMASNYNRRPAGRSAVDGAPGASSAGAKR